jgi:hypothetical protein
MAKRKILYDEAMVTSLYVDGKTITDISKIVGVSRGVLARFLEKSGTRVRQLKGHTDDSINEWYQYYKVKPSLRCVCKKFGVERNSVRREFVRRGWIKYEPKVKVDENSIVSFYIQSKKIGETSERFGIDPSTVKNILVSHGVDLHQKHNYLIDNESGIVAEYKQLLSLKQVAGIFSITVGAVRKILKKNRIKIVRTKYTWDDDFFARDTQEAFYFAGFIAADGCVSKREYSDSVKISIKNTDREVLDALKRYLEFDGPIRDGHCGGFNGCRQVGMSITSKKMCADLKRFGIDSCKSFTYKIPNEIKCHPLVNHFLRGLVDGDGWINSKQSLVVGLCGSNDSVGGFIDIVSENCAVKSKTPRAMKSIFAVEYCGDDSRKIIDFLYNGAKDDLLLARKKVNAFAPSRTRADTRIPVIATNIVTGEVIEFESLTAARKAAFCPQNIHRCIEGMVTSHKGYAWKLKELTDDST